jgi:uncharacterized protein with PIN domain
MPQFVVDTMLGRLAHWLRAMGYDTIYLGQADDPRLLEISVSEDRILVTRDRKLARAAEQRGCLIRTERVEDQLAEVVATLGLSPPPADWLSRCLECNARLERREKAAIRACIPDYVFATQSEFMGCPGCGKIYWVGSHADRILTRLGRMLGREGTGRYHADPHQAP